MKRSRRVHRGASRRGPRGFTLVELLVVILIILLVSAVALPTVLPAINHRQVSEAARILQGALAGARDKAIHDNQPSGIRLLPDPAFPITWMSTNTINPYSILAYNRMIPIGPAPEYSEGYCTPLPIGPPLVAGTFKYSWSSVVIPAIVASAHPKALLLIENPVNPKTGAPNPPTSWFWNIRIGDKIQLNNAGPWYTVIGPMTVQPITGNNAELFVNVGLPDSLANLSNKLPHVGGQPVEYLLLVNGRDDNNNGWVDEGFDGVDNNGINLADEFAEWEQEQWIGSISTQSSVDIPYTIRRRPMPSPNAREVALPTSMVIDATSLFFTKERSRLPIDLQTQFSGSIDIVLNPDGTVLPTTTYSSPSSFRIDQSFYHFWLSERQDLSDVRLNSAGTGPVSLGTGTAVFYLPVPEPAGRNARTYTGPTIKGDYSLLTLFTRTGQTVVNQSPPFDDPVAAAAQRRAFNINLPFIAAQQGVNGGP